jgi:hypothetical protein
MLRQMSRGGRRLARTRKALPAPWQDRRRATRGSYQGARVRRAFRGRECWHAAGSEARYVPRKKMNSDIIDLALLFHRIGHVIERQDLASKPSVGQRQELAINCSIRSARPGAKRLARSTTAGGGTNSRIHST